MTPRAGRNRAVGSVGQPEATFVCEKNASSVLWYMRFGVGDRETAGLNSKRPWRLRAGT
jgi:hypothetical protein